MKIVHLVVLFLLGLSVICDVVAHASLPVYIHIEEAAGGEVHVLWKVPKVLPYIAAPVPEMPITCRKISRRSIISLADGYSHQQTYKCDSLEGGIIGLHYPQHNPGLSAVFHISLADGQVHTRVMGPDKNNWIVPSTPSILSIVHSYLLLGIDHILGGADHLLFVLLLVFIASHRSRLLVAVTGFTLGHSITLSFAALEIVYLPVPLVEAFIALSIMLLACEIICGNSDSVTYRYPGYISAGFGLLHGFGFANALQEFGLPHNHMITALLSFNVGIEIGQLIFIFAVILVAGIVRFLLEKQDFFRLSLVSSFNLICAYIGGTIAAFWYIDRIETFWA